MCFVQQHIHCSLIDDIHGHVTIGDDMEKAEN